MFVLAVIAIAELRELSLERGKALCLRSVSSHLTEAENKPQYYLYELTQAVAYVIRGLCKMWTT